MLKSVLHRCLSWTSERVRSLSETIWLAPTLLAITPFSLVIMLRATEFRLTQALFRSLYLPPPKDANDPDNIGDSDQAGDQPQQGADRRVQRQAYTQTQCEDQESSSGDRHMQNHSQYHHALYDTMATRPSRNNGRTGGSGD